MSPNDSFASENFHTPKNSHEFQKYWRKCHKDKSTKYQYLLAIGGPVLAVIFQVEISMGVLGEIIEILNESWKKDDFSMIYKILHNLSTVKRFDLALQFLSSQEKQALVELFVKLRRMVIEEENKASDPDSLHLDNLEALKENYKVTLH